MQNMENGTELVCAVAVRLNLISYCDRFDLRYGPSKFYTLNMRWTIGTFPTIRRADEQMISALVSKSKKIKKKLIANFSTSAWWWRAPTSEYMYLYSMNNTERPCIFDYYYIRIIIMY